MAKGRWKITLGLRLNEFGATESYVSPLNEESLMSTRLEELLDARLMLLHEAVSVVGLRVAQVADDADQPLKRKSKLHRPGMRYVFQLPDANGQNGRLITIASKGKATAAEFLPDHERSLAIVRLTYGGGRSTQRYFFGFPDASMNYQPPTAAAYSEPAVGVAWDKFVTQVRKGGWSIYARAHTGDYKEVPVLKWIQAGAAGSLTGVEIKAEAAPPIVKGSLVAIKGTRRRGTDKMSYNGQYRVDSTAPGTTAAILQIWLAMTEAGVASSVKNPGTIQLVGKTFQAIDFLEVIMAGAHKRGKPLTTQRGNRKRRALLDP